MTSLICAIERTVTDHNLARPGLYGRWKTGPDGAESPGNRAYGTADAAGILYTVGAFPREEAERRAWVESLRSFQDSETGLYHGDHHPYHATAFCIAALELFDAGPAYPVLALDPIRSVSGLERFLDRLDWVEKPWSESHQGAGVYVSLVLTGATSPAWQDAYFSWLDAECDPETGFWRRTCVEKPGAAPLFHHLAGSFHYLFNYECARRPWPYPDRVIDSCLRILEGDLHPGLGASIGFSEIDWVYCLNRASRQTEHRWWEAKAALERFGRAYVAYLEGVDRGADDGWNDLHRLFGAACALAELQQAVPGLVRTSKPLRLVLDRRPFI